MLLMRKYKQEQCRLHKVLFSEFFRESCQFLSFLMKTFFDTGGDANDILGLLYEMETEIEHAALRQPCPEFIEACPKS